VIIEKSSVSCAGEICFGSLPGGGDTAPATAFGAPAKSPACTDATCTVVRRSSLDLGAATSRVAAAVADSIDAGFPSLAFACGTTPFVSAGAAAACGTTGFAARRGVCNPTSAATGADEAATNGRAGTDALAAGDARDAPSCPVSALTSLPPPRDKTPERNPSISSIAALFCATGGSATTTGPLSRGLSLANAAAGAITFGP